MKRAMTIALALSLAGAAGIAMGQAAPAAPDGKGQVVLSWDQFVKITGWDPSAKPGAQQMLTIPWSEVEALLNVKVDKIGTATVDLPWQEFKKLLEWSVKQKEGKPDVPPPTDYIIASSEYKGVLTDDGAKFTLTVKLNILRKEGWKRIPVLPAGIAVTTATLPNGVYLNSVGGNYELLTEQSGPIDVSLAFAVAVAKSAGASGVSFRPIMPTASILDLSIDREQVDVKVAQAQSLLTTSADGKTSVAAAIPAGAAVDVSWERALPKVEAAPTKLYAETRTLVSVAEGVLLGHEMVYFNILHTAVRELSLQVPPGVSVLEVSGNGLQDWRVDDAGVLKVVLRSDTIGAYSLRLAYEKAAADAVEAPVVRATGVEREKGYVGVIALANVEISAGAVTGATTLDVRQLPADIVAMTNQPILLGFRYVSDQFNIPLKVKKHEAVGVLVTIVDSALYTGMQLNDGRRMTKAVYSVRNNRNQFLRLTMPAGAEIWSVSVAGNTVAPAKDETGKLLIPLVRSQAGSSELASFPVEIVYVATPAETAPGSGTLHVDLPGCGVPTMHVMYNLYLPAEGKYTVGWGASGFSGNLRLVEGFTSVATGPGVAVIERNAAAQAAGMQQQFDTRVDQQAKVAGVTPIRVSLPLQGTLFKLEKVLALPQDTLFFDVQYRDWKVAK